MNNGAEAPLKTLVKDQAMVGRQKGRPMKTTGFKKDASPTPPIPLLISRTWETRLVDPEFLVVSLTAA